jgi:hypothetical protein
VYDRLVKNLQTLKKESLLKSKDYGLGKENLWSLKPHPIIRELGYTPPKSEIHTFKYEHEKACADVFVTFALSGNLYDWEAHKRRGKMIPDRIAETDTTIFIEVEMGSQDKIRQKLEAYQQYHRETREEFQVLFLVKPPQLESASEIVKEVTHHYRVELLDRYQHFEPLSDTLSDTSSESEDSILEL